MTVEQLRHEAAETRLEADKAWDYASRRLFAANKGFIPHKEVMPAFIAANDLFAAAAHAADAYLDALGEDWSVVCVD